MYTNTYNPHNIFAGASVPSINTSKIVDNALEQIVYASEDNSQVLTTSLIVAKVFGKEHSRVLKDIRGLSCSENFAQVNFALGSYLDENQQERPMYQMTRDGFTILAMGYTGKKAMLFKERYIEAFNKMEAELKRLRTPQTFAQALRLAAEQAEMIEQQQKMLEEAKPKTEYFDALVERNLLTNIRDTAKELHVKQSVFVSWLIGHGYVYRDKKNKLKPHAQYTPSLFELKECKNDNGWVGNQLLITPKGRETFRLILQGTN